MSITTRNPSLAAVLKSFFKSLTMIADGSIVPGEDTEVERLVIVKHAHIGIEGCRLALVRFVLKKAVGDGCVPPGRFVECAVQDDRPAGARGGHAALEARRVVVDTADRLRHGRAGNRQQGAHGEQVWRNRAEAGRALLSRHSQRDSSRPHPHHQHN